MYMHLRGPRFGMVGVDGLLLAGLIAMGCGGGGAKPDGGADGGGAGAGGGGGAPAASPLVVSAATRRPRVTTSAVNYWQWAPSYGNDIAGTEAPVAALAPGAMRVGGYNNDANSPDPFGDAQLDEAVAYARAVGAEPIIQVPLLADVAGKPPTPDTAAAMVRYANVSKSYGLKYFSIGNEPDLYDTQGLPSDSTKPALPGFGPADYCARARAYVTAMKAVDPTIQIVGPDLAYKYQAGNGSYDWLTPILQGCGELFDVVSIHRYPFEAAQATLTAAAADGAAFQSVMTSVRALMRAAGQGGKPLALTEMNVAYDATACVLGASPGTVGAALWLADILGEANDLGLWTSAVWNISDTEEWSLGLIGLPPAHAPRPAYYAYALYAAHFGPTLLDVTSLPAGVHAHASRNAADDATLLVVLNWNASPAAVRVEITGLAAAPARPTFVLPGVSLAALEVPDTGAASAWVYGEAERQAGAGPRRLAQGESTVGGVDGGGGGADGSAGVVAGKMVGSGCASDGGVVCAQIPATTAAITTMGTGSGASLGFGPAAQKWGSYSYAATGQTAPTGTVTADGNGLQIAGGFVAPVRAATNYAGLGLYFASSGCLDGSSYEGVKFDFSGDLGGCLLGFGASFSGDLSHLDDANRGACAGSDSTCYGPSTDVTAAALAATPAAPTIKVPFASLAAGLPIATLDPRTIVSVQWQLSTAIATSDGGGCAASFTVENVSFY